KKDGFQRFGESPRTIAAPNTIASRKPARNSLRPRPSAGAASPWRSGRHWKHRREVQIMPLLVKARSFLRNLFFTRRLDADLDQEVHSHLEMLIEEKLRAGMTSAEAQRAARIELGGVEQVKIHVRESRTGAFLDSLVQDVRFAIRSLRRTAGLT